MHKKELEDAGCSNVEKTLEKQFSSWFKEHVSVMSTTLLLPYIISCIGINHAEYSFRLQHSVTLKEKR